MRERDWTGNWKGVIYNYHHYHSHAHEVLVVLSGSAQVILGGAGGPELRVEAGDVLLLPAGVGHCSPSHSPDFEVMGGYAAGREWDICRPEETDLAWAQARIAEVPDWEQEPV
ncbi:cupin domain-containing protein [Deinococcus lacus]|uniref:Cupin domain-containing protein n=1 Tax=Deinococcus lacus TaxID=392561 RepID=A0ABW1YDC9_9DEIO